jgi:predicted RecB family nuclease
MTRPITSDLVEAYSLCPRKASLLLAGIAADPGPHDYELLLREQADANRQAHRLRLAEAVEITPFNGPEKLASGLAVLADAVLTADGLLARCDFLKKADETSRSRRHLYEPVKVIGTQRAARTDGLGLAFQGLVLGEVQGKLPASGTLVRLGDQAGKAKLAAKYKEVRKIVELLKGWASDPATQPPPVVLNKHCPVCPFRDACRRQAEKEDNLSLLDRMTPRLMKKYQEKGIFTIQQLSYVYKPRRSRKKGKRQVRHSLELQALALRTDKIHVEHLPDLVRGPVELFVDLEGIPDRSEHYLAGLLVCKGEEVRYEPFWADDAAGEAAMWSALADRLAAFPDVPIYHYGSYEKKVFATLAKRHSKGEDLVKRLVNVASSLYGKVYFPVRSNGLKSLGRFLGATWTEPEASGLLSLAWRLRWEANRDERWKQSLLRYNREDCEAVRLLVDRLDRIRRDAASDSSIEFAGRPKRHATETGQAVHGQLERILKSAQEAYAGRGIRIRQPDVAVNEPKKAGAPKGHQAFQRLTPTRVSKVVLLPARKECPRGHSALVAGEEQEIDKTITDLVFSRNGCRKTVTRYTGPKVYCRRCSRWYGPAELDEFERHQFGHAFQAWVAYQRVVLRLPYRILTQVTEHLFGVGLCQGSVVHFLEHLADRYSVTEESNLQATLRSPFVHVDETKLNIQGVDHYVWVFTDGRHVVFRLTETREADIVREVLADYQGVLVSDFYPGYDAIPCRQQKCLVHLIRDINDDLWKFPFDKELETFAVEVQNLLVPILEAVDRYGLKAYHLRKFIKDVDRFYDRNITGREYASEPVRTYQKRFDRYRGSLFTFLTQDGIPWENNMAERAIRQLAVQRKISSYFSKRVASHYLLLLAISQTCRFQGKSFLKFLLSKETDVDAFKRTRPIKYSYAVPRREEDPAAGNNGEATTP